MNIWYAIKEAPTSIKLWCSLFEQYIQNDMPWQAFYVAKKIAKLDSKISIDDLLKSFKVIHDADRILSGASLENAEGIVEKFNSWLDHHSNDWLTWIFLCRVCDYLPSSYKTTHEYALSRSERLEYIEGESRHLLGYWRLKSGDAQGALMAFQQLINMQKTRFGTMLYLGEALLHIGNVPAAEKAFSRASMSANPRFLQSLAKKVYAFNYWSEAIAILNKSINLEPNNEELYLDLFAIQSDTYQLEACQKTLSQVEQINPLNEKLKYLKLSLLAKSGYAEDYFCEIQKIYQANKPINSRMVSSILMTALYLDELSAFEISTLHSQLCSEVEMSNSSGLQKLKKRKSQSGRLRIAYITGDLYRQHPVNIFMLPLLEEQKNSDLEVYIYNTGMMYDSYTKRAKQCANKWINASDMDDVTLRASILEDEVDILIDLAGHTSTHRLGVFLSRAAPVQVSFLGYPHSTGLRCIDYLIGDHVVSPVDHQHLFTENLLQLKSSVFCWAPVDDYPLQEQKKGGAIVFGSFNNALKLSPRTISLWSRILKEIPSSRLLLKAPSFAGKEVCEIYRKKFEFQGITSERIEFRGPSELSLMMQEYHDIDIALDPISYNGGTTSLQAMWMGVPLISLCGESFHNRMGASFLKTLNKTEWVAQDEDAYVAIAKRLAGDIANQSITRADLRAQMKDSQLCDIKQYARNFEELLRSTVG
jgi:predicted O-linked N-acetylglucosamine transferase (SPINDLY family)